MEILDCLLDVLFPRRCMFCGELMEEKDFVCKVCERDLPWLPDPLCEEVMESLDRLYCALYYDKNVPQGMANFKFHGKSHLSVYFAELMLHQMGTELKTEHFDCIVAVPMQSSKLRKRGYNQAELLAKQLSMELNVPLSSCLKKIRRSQTQHELSGRERRNAQKGSYGCDPLQGEKILLVDDICTTGSTLKECAHTLKAAGASCVVAAAVCRTPNYKKSNREILDRNEC